VSEIVKFRLPDGNQITVKLIDLCGDLDRRDGGVTIQPVSDNAKSVHHHSFEDRDGNWNILIRDQNNQNITAYVLNKRNGSWTERELTDAEKRNR
jgi:hypothetical protein